MIIAVIIGGGSTKKIYVKVNGVWVEYSKIYRKINGSWVEQSDFSSLYTYLNGNNILKE